MVVSFDLESFSAQIIDAASNTTTVSSAQCVESTTNFPRLRPSNRKNAPAPLGRSLMSVLIVADRKAVNVYSSRCQSFYFMTVSYFCERELKHPLQHVCKILMGFEDLYL